MVTKQLRMSIFFTFLFLLLLVTTTKSLHANPEVTLAASSGTTLLKEKARGIYLTQYTLENTAFLTSLIRHAKTSGINTFIVDYEFDSKNYQQNIALVKENKIKWVARIVMFPGGGTKSEIEDPAIWQKKYALVKRAVTLGADEIQLDYIRYKASQKPTAENAKRILHIIQWYKTQLAAQNIPLQIDVFGIASFGESKYIGQNIQLFANSVDAICPMVYPSHFEPFSEHYKKPYTTIKDALTRIDKMFPEKRPFKMYAWIELSNYHYPMSGKLRIPYIKEQIRAVLDANADGWYAWSPHNRYDYLFQVLENK